jgi:hypothetical protein
LPRGGEEGETPGDHGVTAGGVRVVDVVVFDFVEHGAADSGEVHREPEQADGPYFLRVIPEAW